jgi:hypothetical protein
MNKKKLLPIYQILDLITSLNNRQDDILRTEEVLEICKDLQEYEFVVTTAKSFLKELIVNKLQKYPPFPNDSVAKDIEQYFNLIGYCMVIDSDSKKFLTYWGVEFPLKSKSLLAYPVEGYINLFTKYRDNKKSFEEEWSPLNHEKLYPYFSHIVNQLIPYSNRV